MVKTKDTNVSDRYSEIIEKQAQELFETKLNEIIKSHTNNDSVKIIKKRGRPAKKKD